MAAALPQPIDCATCDAPTTSSSSTSTNNWDFVHLNGQPPLPLAPATPARGQWDLDTNAIWAWDGTQWSPAIV